MKRGVAVTLIGSATNPLTDTYFAVGAERLKTSGVKLRYLLTTFIHTKVIIADGERALGGSINLSGNSLDASRELGVVLTRNESPEIVSELVNQLEADSARSVEINPFTLPPLETVQPADRMNELKGRIATLEGVVCTVHRTASVAFLLFDTGENAPRAVVFARAFDSFPQPFPEVFLEKTCAYQRARAVVR